MVFLITTASLRHRSGWYLTVRRHSALLADSCQLTANSLQLTADSFYLLTAFPTTVIDSSLALRMTPFVLRHYDAFRSPLLVTCFPQIVILNGGKNALWERRETTTWHRVKNLLLWMTSYHFPHYGNRSFTFASDDILWFSSSQQQVFDIASGWRLSSIVILNGGKNALWEKRETATWQRVKNLWL